MSLDEKDFQKLGAMLDEKLDLKLDAKIGVLKKELVFEIKQTSADLGELILDQNRAELKAMKNEIVAEVSDLVGESIVPQIDDHETRIAKLETKMAV